MLTLLLGTDWIQNRDYILNQIARNVSDRISGQILMVPEFISHDTERRLCKTAGDTASRFAEVLSFTRLCTRVYESCGHKVQPCLDNGGRLVAMASAVRQLHSKLKAYASVETRPEFLAGLIDAVDEFKRCCITADDLMAASKKSEGSFAQKLEELSLIMQCYDALCQNGKKDPADQMSWLLEELESCDFAQKHIFYIDGFPDFTGQHMAILEHLIRNSENVTVSLNCDNLNSGKVAFEKAADTAKKILQFAKRWEIPYKIETVAPRNDSLLQLRNKVFQGAIDEKLPGDILTLYRTETVHQECLVLAQKIKELVCSGARYRDISVVCADPASYQHTAKMVFERCHIPLYLSGTEDILEMSVIATVLSAIDTALGGFELQDVLQYLKSSLSPMDLNMADRVENYARMWAISGRRWLKDWEYHPDGLGCQWTPEATQTLKELNTAREKALQPLIKLRDGFRNATRLSQQIHALYNLLEEIELRQYLDKLAGELERRGDLRNAQILNQLWEILISALEQLYDVLGETAWDGETFTHLFRLLLSQYDVGTIPPVLDSVTMGSVSAMRCQQAKHLFIVGALEGAFPGYTGSVGVLTDQERVQLRQMGVPLTGGAMEGLQAEFADIYGVFSGATDTVTVSCPGGQCSFIYQRLALLGTEIPVDYTISTAMCDPLEAGAYFVRMEDATSAQRLGIGTHYQDIDSKKNHNLGTVLPEHIQALYGQTLKLSASQVDKLADCRLSYFLRYGLRAKEQKQATVDPAEFGTYVHAVLENTARKIKQMGGFHKVSFVETLEIAKGFSQEYTVERFSQIDSERLSFLFHRNTLELERIVKELWEELQNSDFEPLEFELSFGDDGYMPAISIQGKTMDADLRGFVDRVDCWKQGEDTYFRVVDYKTGKKSFDYCDVFNGLGLQMLLYLFALEDNGGQILGENRIGAGVQYFPARVPVVTADCALTDEQTDIERQKMWQREGLLLADDTVLQAMEHGDKVIRLPISRKSDGNVYGEIATQDQFGMLKLYVFRLLAKMVDDIASGNIAANPYTRGSNHNACTYCPYKAVCHMESVTERRNYKTMQSGRFWEEIQKEVDTDG